MESPDRDRKARKRNYILTENCASSLKNSEKSRRDGDDEGAQRPRSRVR